MFILFLEPTIWRTVNVTGDPRELSCKVIKWNELAEDHVGCRFSF